METMVSLLLFVVALWKFRGSFMEIGELEGYLIETWRIFEYLMEILTTFNDILAPILVESRCSSKFRKFVPEGSWLVLEVLEFLELEILSVATQHNLEAF